MVEIYVIGTYHVSRKSVEEVSKIIEEVRPDAVAVELCPRRFNALMKGFNEKLEDALRGNIALALIQIILAYYQRKIGKEMGVKPGEEMITAIKKAKEIGADILLIDRDIGITFQRLWDKVSIIEKLKFIFSILKGFSSKEESKEEIDLTDVNSLLEEFRKYTPKASEVLIDERDAYMANRIISASNNYRKIVVVVGAGHKDGIENYLRNPEKIPSIEELLSVKRGRFKFSKLFGWMISILIVSTFIHITLRIGSDVALKAFAYWFIINGTLSALGALIAGAHPLSIIAAFLCAWLTSINPLIAAGWITGYVELKMRKPNAKDLLDLFEVEKFRDLLKNRAFRVLLVAALTNLGSIIGTFYGAYMVIQMTGVDIRNLIP